MKASNSSKIQVKNVSENKTKMTFALFKYKKFENICQGAHGFASGSGSIWIKKDKYIIVITLGVGGRKLFDNCQK